MRKKICVGAFGALGALAGTCVLPATAGASSLPSPAFSAIRGGHVSFGVSKTPGDNEAGYIQNLANPDRVNTFGVLDKVATITCTNRVTTGEADLVIVGGKTASGGYDAAGIVVAYSCSGTTASYSAVPIADATSDGPSIQVNPGDIVLMGVRVGKDTETVVVEDETTGAHSIITGVGYTPVNAQVSVEAGTYGVNTGFPKSDQHQFELQLNGYGYSSQRVTGFDMVDPAGNVEMAASPLANKGQAFNVHYYQNY